MGIDAKLDIIYNVIDNLLLKGRFDLVDLQLRRMDVENANTDILLGYLTITFAAKSKLPSRPAFFERAEQTLKKRPEWDELLLYGLK
jgi:hypothetical protein